ncbi:MAG: FAD-binding oxidoreductase, partial [Chloroflexota bacterium]
TKAGGRVVKNVTGYDMAKLYVGSLGTLAVIVEATFKLTPLPPTARTMFIGCGSLDEGLALTQRITEARLQVAACELLDAVTQARIPGTDASVQRRWLLALEFWGNTAAVARQCGEVASMVRQQSAVMAEATGPGGRTFWDAVRDKGRVFGEPALIVRAQTLPTATRKMATELSRIANERRLQPATSLRPLNGTVYAHWTPTDIRLGEPAEWRALIAKLRDAARAAGGSLVVEDAAWALGGVVDVWGPPPPSFSVMQRMKQQFDPERLLNPGRFVGRL